MDKARPAFEPGGKLHAFRSVYDGMDTFLFTPSETSRSGVHIHDSMDSKRTMIIVVLALMPCFLFGMYNTGLFAATTGVSFAVFAALYALVWRVTSGAYCDIVGGTHA